MAPQKPITDCILELLQDSKDCHFEALVARYPEFTPSEIDQAVSRLSRAGKVKITRGVGTCTIRQIQAAIVR